MASAQSTASGGYVPWSKERAEAFRLRTQSIADFASASPVPSWPNYLVAIGAASVGAGSAEAVSLHPQTFADWYPAYALYLIGASLVAVALAVLAVAESKRVAAYRVGRRLFSEWASHAGEPREEDLVDQARMESKLRLDRSIEETRKLMEAAHPEESEDLPPV